MRHEEQEAGGVSLDKNTLTRYEAIRERVAKAAQIAGRDPASIKLIAVTKTFEAEAIQPVLMAGHTRYGENRVQEALRKWQPLRKRHEGVELHLIGPLQSNKAAEAVALFDVIHSIDRTKIAAALAGEIEKQGKTPKLLVQVNTGREPQKAGIAPEEAEEFVALCRNQHNLDVNGLMCIPPFHEDPVPHFNKLAELREQCGLDELSMGMSGDFEQAIFYGATIVRIGSAIFGAR